MPMQFHYNRSENIAITQGTGMITFSDFLGIYDEMAKARIDVGYRSIADHRAADFSRLTTTNIQQAKLRGNQVISDIGGNDRFAIVASNSLEFGMSRMFEMTRESPLFNMCVFSNIHKALLWLDISPETMMRIASEGGISLRLDVDLHKDLPESNQFHQDTLSGT